MIQNNSVLPERRNPQHANAEGSEGGAPEFTALKLETFYPAIVTKCKPVTNSIAGNKPSNTSRNTLRLGSNSQGRKTVCVNAGKAPFTLIRQSTDTRNGGPFEGGLKPFSQPGGSLKLAELTGQTSSHLDGIRQVHHLITTVLDKIDELLASGDLYRPDIKA